MCYLFLWYILYNITSRNCESISNGEIGKTSFTRIITFIIKLLKGFDHDYINPGSLEQRLDISREYMDSQYRRMAVIMDATHTPVVKPFNSSFKDYWSYKLKTSAVNTLVCIFYSFQINFSLFCFNCLGLHTSKHENYLCWKKK